MNDMMPTNTKRGVQRDQEIHYDQKKRTPSTTVGVMTRQERFSLDKLPQQTQYTISYMHRDIVTHLCTSKLGFIITASRDGVLKLWYNKPPKPSDLTLSTGDNTNTTYDLEFQRSFQAHTGPLLDIVVSLSGQICISVGIDRVVNVYNLSTSDIIRSFTLPFIPSCFDLYHYVTTHPVIIFGSFTGHIYIYDLSPSKYDLVTVSYTQPYPIVFLKCHPIHDTIIISDIRGSIDLLSLSDRYIHRSDNITGGDGILLPIEFKQLLLIGNIQYQGSITHNILLQPYQNSTLRHTILLEWSLKSETDLFFYLRYKHTILDIQWSNNGNSFIITSTIQQSPSIQQNTVSNSSSLTLKPSISSASASNVPLLPFNIPDTYTYTIFNLSSGRIIQQFYEGISQYPHIDSSTLTLSLDIVNRALDFQNCIPHGFVKNISNIIAKYPSSSSVSSSLQPVQDNKQSTSSSTLTPLPSPFLPAQYLFDNPDAYDFWSTVFIPQTSSHVPTTSASSHVPTTSAESLPSASSSIISTPDTQLLSDISSSLSSQTLTIPNPYYIPDIDTLALAKKVTTERVYIQQCINQCSTRIEAIYKSIVATPSSSSPSSPSSSSSVSSTRNMSSPVDVITYPDNILSQTDTSSPSPSSSTSSSSSIAESHQTSTHNMLYEWSYNGGSSTLQCIYDPSDTYIIVPYPYGIKYIRIRDGMTVHILGKPDLYNMLPQQPSSSSTSLQSHDNTSSSSSSSSSSTVTIPISRFSSLALCNPPTPFDITLLVSHNNTARKSIERISIIALSPRQERFFIYSHVPPPSSLLHQSKSTTTNANNNTNNNHIPLHKRDIINERIINASTTINMDNTKHKTSLSSSSSSTTSTQQQRPRVVLQTSLGDITLELYRDVAPKTCLNFTTLSSRGYYTNTIFHRIIPGFMIQGGDPTGTGRGGESIYGTTFPDEISSLYSHNTEGVLSMANAGKDTNGSQFFITLAPCRHLDGKHTIFGRVSHGMDVVKQMSKVQTGVNDKPLKPIKILGVSLLDQ